MLRRRGLSAINLIGLTVGLAAGMMILLFVRHEYAFDRFHTDAHRIYRLISVDSLGAGLNRSSIQIGHLAGRIADGLPAIDGFARMHRRGAVFSTEREPFRVGDYYWGDQAFFDLFDYTLEAGDVAQALTAPNALVLSSELATRLFGASEALGRIVRVDDEFDMVVTGILAPPKGPTHMPIQAIGSMLTLGEFEQVWDPRNQGWTYLRLSEGADPADVEANVNGRLPSIVTWMNLDKYHVRYRLQPLADIRLHSSDIAAPGNVGDVRQVRLFMLVGLLILLLACANFTNMAMARSVQRLREVGMRKTLGASRRQVTAQFMLEALLSVTICLVLALAVIESLVPWFNSMTGQSIPGLLAGTWDVWLWMPLVAVTAAVLGGAIPALHVSRYQPAEIMKGGRTGRTRSRTREVLVVGQFVISTTLMVASIGIHAQLRFIQAQNPGFQTENVIQLSNAGSGVRPGTLIEALGGLSSVVSASHSSGVPIVGGMISDMHRDEDRTMSKRLIVDEHYVETLGLELSAGRWMNAPFASDATAEFVVNEAYVRFKGWDHPLQEQLPSGYDEQTGESIMRPVVGVVKDFHTGSAREPIIPTVLDARPSMARFRFMYLVRIAPGDPAHVLDEIRNVWATVAPDRPFSATFVDDSIQALYESERRMARLLTVFTVLAIGIACLGLFGLAALTAEFRTKEMGIRRVLGASTTRIVQILSADFLKMVVLAVAIAIPIAWYGLERWLTEFAVRIELAWTMPLAVAALVTGVAWATVASQAWKTAGRNPVDSLRSE